MTRLKEICKALLSRTCKASRNRNQPWGEMTQLKKRSQLIMKSYLKKPFNSMMGLQLGEPVSWRSSMELTWSTAQMVGETRTLSRPRAISAKFAKRQAWSLLWWSPQTSAGLKRRKSTLKITKDASATETPSRDKAILASLSLMLSRCLISRGETLKLRRIQWSSKRMEGSQCLKSRIL